jgi:SAM-dependent methyltransferase
VNARPRPPSSRRRIVDRPRILFVSHPAVRCGVHQYGLTTAAELRKSRRYEFLYRECSSPADLRAAFTQLQPRVIIYNFTLLTLPWVTRDLLRTIPVPHVGILHEGTQRTADSLDTDLFHYHIAPDPTLLLFNSLVYKSGRVIPRFTNTKRLPRVPVIGSFGFGTPGKGFDAVVRQVQDEFDRAVIRLHIPLNDVVDRDGARAQAVIDQCRALVTKPGIRLDVTQHFLSNNQLLDFLAGNSLNAFFYATNEGRGISSVLDYALAVRRPIAITRSVMFRHLFDVQPSICIEDSSLRQILRNGFAPLANVAHEWTAENLLWDFERIIESILNRPLIVQPYHPFLKRVRRFLRKRLARTSLAGDKLMRAPALPPVTRSGAGRRQTAASRATITGARKFNRILDDAARRQYAPVIDTLSELLPDMMSRKMARANIQQAFVFDTVRHLASRKRGARILAVGSYEDTAAHALRALGASIDMIDPIINYDLATFLHKPSTKRGSYDVVLSTSVLEHVRDDVQFLADIATLLAPGGFAVLTCDFNDQYRPGDTIPPEDFRFYTQNDIIDRLLPRLTDCALADTPSWDCPSPDFEYAGCRYTFASMVFRKKKPR